MRSRVQLVHPSFELEIGSGRGAFLVARARQHPARIFVGVEASPGLVERSRQAAGSLPNCQFVCADVWDYLNSIEERCVVVAHLYFPTPVGTRNNGPSYCFIDPKFLDTLASKLELGGEIRWASDVAGLSAAVIAHARLRNWTVRGARKVPFHRDQVSTSRWEQKTAESGSPISFRLTP